MSHQDYQVRRATVDDLQTLVRLWEAMRYPVAELEKRLTEFQVVQTAAGEVIAALGMEINGRQGRLHSEAFQDFAQADLLRQRLWERMQAVATNHGLVRVWTQETAPFWSQAGLQPPPADKAGKLPEAWSTLPGNWTTLQLRDEDAVAHSLDKEFLRFKEMEKANTQRVLDQARMLKIVATFLGVLAAAAALFVCLYVLNHRALLQGHHP